MDNAIQLYDRMENPVEAIERLGSFFAKSGLFGCDREAQGQVLALVCMAERKSPIEITRTYHLVDGKLSKKALAIAAEFRSKGGKIEWLNTGKDGQKAEARFTFEGQTLTESFTIEEAKRQGLVREKSTWIKAPANMLRARVLSNAIAMLAPEIVAGVSGNPEDDSETTPAETKPLLTKKEDPKPEPKNITPPVNTPPEKPESHTSASTTCEPVEAELVLTKTAEAVNGKLTVATIQTLEHHIGEHAALAEQWLKAKGHLKQSFGDVPVHIAQKIIDAPAKFIAAIGGGK